MHQLEWNVSHQFTAHGTEIEFDTSHVRNDETGSFVAFGDDSRRSQIDFIVLSNRMVIHFSVMIIEEGFE
jgi:hypothetical protein